ncbi:MAG TPA: Fic family protein [Thermoanaerobaculia bacterium]|nr:Fic family protein [Thermoanaerobaculia bacterium]
MPVEWNEDDPRDLRVIQSNLRQIVLQILKEAPERSPPTVALAQGWHRRIFQGVRLPVDYFAGEIRDSDSRFPELFGYEVIVSGHAGVASSEIPSELADLEVGLQQAVSNLDSVIPVGIRPSGTAELHAVLTLCAHAHGEWVRIHPFANGNGRTARLWANWCAVRYRLPAFVQLKPRPDSLGYAAAAARSMTGDHWHMVAEFMAMLRIRLRG